MSLPMSVAPLNLLIVVNPNASRAVEALPRIAQWFAERHQLVVVGNSQEELEALRSRASSSSWLLPTTTNWWRSANHWAIRGNASTALEALGLTTIKRFRGATLMGRLIYLTTRTTV